MINDQNTALYAFEKFGDAVLRAAYATCGSFAEAEDITQEVFLTLHSKPQSFDSEEHLKAWLLRAAINKAKNFKRSFRVSRTESSDASEIEMGSYNEQFGETDLHAAVRALPEKYASVIFLYYYEGYTIPEIANIIGKNQNTVSTLLRRGRDKLKLELTKEDIIYET